MSQIIFPSNPTQIVGASLAATNDSMKILVVGQKLAAGTATAERIQKKILSDGSEDVLFGSHSMLAGMIRKIKQYNKDTQVDALPLDDDSEGLAATCDITFTGTATKEGTLSISLGSKSDYKFDVPVSVNDTHLSIVTKLLSLIGSNNNIPVEVAKSEETNETGLVITALHKGLEFNDFGIYVEGSIAGISYTVTKMSGGTSNPALTNISTIIGENRYQTIVIPSSYDFSVFSNFTKSRINSGDIILDGVVFQVKIDDFENFMQTYNNPAAVIFADKKLSAGGSVSKEIGYISCASIAALEAKRLTQDANISDIVISTNGLLDATGGPALASKPLANTPIAFIEPFEDEETFSHEQMKLLVKAGFAVFGNNQASTEVIMGEVPTTYLTDNQGAEDLSFKYLNYFRTASCVREYFQKNCNKRFAQSRLTEGALVPGRDMANATLIKSFLTQCYVTLSESEYVLTQAGEDAINYFKDSVTVTLDMAKGEATVTMKTPIVVQLRSIPTTMQIVFSVNN